MRRQIFQRAVWEVLGDPRGPCPFHTKPGLSYTWITSPGAHVPPARPSIPLRCPVLPTQMFALGLPTWGSSEVVRAALSSGREGNRPGGFAQGNQHDLGFGVRRPGAATPSQGRQASGYPAQVCLLRSKMGSSQDGLRAVTGGRQEPTTAGWVGRCWVRGARLTVPPRRKDPLPQEAASGTGSGADGAREGASWSGGEAHACPAELRGTGICLIGTAPLATWGLYGPEAQQLVSPTHRFRFYLTTTRDR